jgi:hypothetical protein
MWVDSVSGRFGRLHNQALEGVAFGGMSGPIREALEGVAFGGMRVVL